MTYTCANCGGTFEAGWSEADALMEYQAAFSEAERSFDADPPGRVCDDCYRAIMKSIEPIRVNR